MGAPCKGVLDQRSRGADVRILLLLKLAPLWGILLGGSCIAGSCCSGFSTLLRVLEPEDRDRFATLTGMLPESIANPVDAVMLMLIRPKTAEASPTRV